MSSNNLINELSNLMRQHINTFIDSTKSVYYGFGAYCDAISHTVLLCANTEDYHNETYHRSNVSLDEEIFRWEIGNWKLPAGLFSSSSERQTSFEEKLTDILSNFGDISQESLEQICKDCLVKIRQSPSSPLMGAEGIVVLGPDDSSDMVLSKRVMFT